MLKGKKIVVFGCDNTGKTTLCKELLDELSGHEDIGCKTIIAKSIGANKTKEEYINFMYDNLSSNDNVIFERFPVIEEMVYGNILRGKNLFTDEARKSVEFLKRVDLFVFCYPGLLRTLNFGEREQMNGVIENVVEIINGFNSFTKMLMDNECCVIEYNYAIDGYGLKLETFIENVIKFLEDKK